MAPRVATSLAPLAFLAMLGLASSTVAADGPGPLGPRESLAAFQLADPSLTIELVASEPEVVSPVAVAWDEDGRMYVAEMTDYPAAAPSGRIRRLEDRDGDGRYESATVFADGLPFPNGVMPCFGGVLVTAAPHIWFFRDRDGDGRADDRQVVLTGFGEGTTQLRVNGLWWGLDNWVYAANGRSDGDIRAPDEPPGRAVSIRHRDVRFRVTMATVPGSGQPVLATVAVEAIAGFSQFGLAHDDWGNRFPSWNTLPLRHVVLEQHSLDRNPYLAATASSAPILSPANEGRIFPISPPPALFNRESAGYFNASCGPVIEGGGLLPAPYSGNAFVCEPLGNLVHRRVLEPDGLSFAARRADQGREFLASSDPAFRPVNLATGPDGALTIVDMYRELIEHPQYVSEQARRTVDFRRWHDRGRIWRVRPKSRAKSGSAPPRLSQAADRELISLLAHPNRWWRTTAQRLLVERQNRAGVPLLKSTLEKSGQPLARLQALWTLAGLDALDATILDRMAGDPHPGLREHALRVAAATEALGRNRSLPTARLAAMAQDPSMRVRLHAALMLGDRSGDDPTALGALGKVAARDAADHWMRLAILSGLAQSSLAFIPLCDAIPAGGGRAHLLAQASALVGVRRRGPELATFLGMVAARHARHPPAQAGPDRSLDALTMLAGLADGLDRSGPPLHSLIVAAPPDLKPHWESVSSLWPAALALAVSDRSVAHRLLAIDVLARGQPELAEAVIPRLLAATQPREVQAAAARALARVGRRTLAVKVLDRWHDLTLATRRDLLSALAGSPALAETLLHALERHVIAPSELDAAMRQRFQHWADPVLRTRASAVLAKSAPPERSSVLLRSQPALQLAGDAHRGESLFAKSCRTCHPHQGHGHPVGPDLSGVAGRAPEALLSDILDPNRNVEPNYVAVVVATHSGQLHAGLLAEETAGTVTIRRAEGIEETFLRSEIDRLQPTGQSLMPEGLEQSLSLQDIADLIAFLRGGG